MMDQDEWYEQTEGVGTMAKIWGISPHYLKKLCSEGKVFAKKIGNTWIIFKNQPRPEIKHYNWKKSK